MRGKKGDDKINSMSPISANEKQKLLKMSYDVNKKYYILLLLGFETGLRVSDLLKLKVKYFQANNHHIPIIEQKTKKKRVLEFSASTLFLLQDYVFDKGLQADDFLIYSAETRKDKPLGRTQAYRVIKKLSLACGIKNMGTHSLRKTFANEFIKNGGSVKKLQRILNHKHISTTRGYLVDFRPVETMEQKEHENMAFRIARRLKRIWGCFNGYLGFKKKS